MGKLSIGAAVAAIGLTLSVCGGGSSVAKCANEVQGCGASSDLPSASPSSSSSTTTTHPPVATVSPLLAGTAHPNVQPGIPGHLDLVYVGAPVALGDGAGHERASGRLERDVRSVEPRRHLGSSY